MMASNRGASNESPACARATTRPLPTRLDRTSIGLDWAGRASIAFTAARSRGWITANKGRDEARHVETEDEDRTCDHHVRNHRADCREGCRGFKAKHTKRDECREQEQRPVDERTEDVGRRRVDLGALEDIRHAHVLREAFEFNELE